MQTYTNKAQGCFLYNKVTKLKTNHNRNINSSHNFKLFPI